MKYFLIALLLVYGSFANASITISSCKQGNMTVYYGDRNEDGHFSYWADHTIGTGSGSFSVSSMTGLSSGDRLIITPGTYTGACSLSHLSNITVVNGNGLVTFTGSNYFELGAGLSNVTISGTGSGSITYGFAFNNINSDAFLFTGTNTQGLYMDHISFNGVVDIIFNVSGYSQKYTGTVNTLKLYKARFSYMTVNKCGQFYQGYYGLPSANIDVVDSVEMSNIIVTQTTTDGVEVAGPITHLNAYNWNITYNGLLTVLGDVGVFQTGGDGQIHHNYFKGGRGYLCRQLLYGLNGVGNFLCYDNIILGQNAYGGFDIRCDTSSYGSTNPYLKYANFTVAFNTIGNKTDINGYITPLVVVGELAPGVTGKVYNNVCFNLIPAGAIGYLDANNSNTTWKVDTIGNYYFPASTVMNYLADTNNNCLPKTGSAIIGKGTVISGMTTDFSNKTRPSPPTPGAEEYGVQATPPTLTSATAATVDNTFKITFTDNATWRAAVTGVLVNGVSMASGYTFAAGTLTFTPSASSLLQVSGNPVITVTAKGYNNAAVTQVLAAGAAVKLAMNTQPTAPASNGAVLATQPKINIDDQYGNTTTSKASITATCSGWTLGGNVTVTAINGMAAFTNLTAVSTKAISATIIFSGSGLTSVTSSSFNIPAPVALKCSCMPNCTKPTISVNTAPVIQLPTSSIALAPTVTTHNGSGIASWQWQLISGNGTITNASLQNITITGLLQGVSVWSVTATDSCGSAASDTVKITVNPATSSISSLTATTVAVPATLTLPDNTTQLTVTSSITPFTKWWSQLSGPNNAKLTNQPSATATASGLVQGTYLFGVSISAGSKTTTSTVAVTVNGQYTLTMYPNPAHSSFAASLTGPGTGAVTLTLYNNSGTALQNNKGTKSGTTYSASFTTAGYMAGTYTLQAVLGTTVIATSILLIN